MNDPKVPDGDSSSESNKGFDGSEDILIGELVEEEGLDPEEARRVVSRFSAYYAGPIPHPSILQGFENVVPGSAQQIVDDAHEEHIYRREMQQREQDHVHSINNRALDATIRESYTGQIFAFLIAVIALVGGIVLVALDKNLGGLSLILPAVASLVGLFIYSQRSSTGSWESTPSQLPQHAPDESESSETQK